MKELEAVLKEIGAKNGLEIALDEDGSCPLELADALEGGNFEIQKMNTGVAGFKTGGVSSIPERLGGKNYREFHSGGSKFVNV